MDMHLSDFQARHDRTASYRANPAKPSGEDIACVQDLADLTRIYAPAVQLCYLPRLPDARIQGYLQAASSRLASGLRQVTDIAAGPPRAAFRTCRAGMPLPKISLCSWRSMATCSTARA